MIPVGQLQWMENPIDLYWRTIHSTNVLLKISQTITLIMWYYERMLYSFLLSFLSFFHSEKLKLKAREIVVISVEICSRGFLRLLSAVSIHRMLSSLQNKVHHEWTATVIAFVCACVCLASGWMYHIAEQYSGRNSWDSFPSSGPNRAQWAPGSNRHWAPPSRSSILHTHLKIWNLRVQKNQNIEEIY